MGLFDFLKRKELSRIEELKSEVSALSRYKNIVDIDREIAYKKAESEKELHQIKENKDLINKDIEILKQGYKDAYVLYQNLKRQNELYTDSLELSEYGIYEPHFDFDTSEKYKEQVLLERDRQKTIIKDNCAVMGGENITWNNSLSQGRAMVKRQKKLMLRAFNGECDSFIASVDWNNVVKMEERINKSFNAINQTYETQGISISVNYKYSKIHELHLVYEHKRKKYEEKEEQRLIRERMREEEKAVREFEAALIKAEKEANDYQKAIEKAKEEASKAEGDKQAKLLAKIQELEERLKEAEANKERAISMAQQTRRGHVYIISNIGSFGENVYKIGMTRRLEPIDRVKELGDASVPFTFDVHAIIFSEDAPKLEHDLHVKFDNRRLNAVNNRKEFFNVSLLEIEQFIKEINRGEIDFIQTAEAKEYRETIALKYKFSRKQEENVFPDKLPI
jgi:hypothetical protein